MSEFVKTSKFIEIDSGHRIPLHNSKCKSIHGHRYRIRVVIKGIISEVESSEEGMGGGLDFSFIKEEMVNDIERYCDHALILGEKDQLVSLLGHDRDCNWIEFDDGSVFYANAVCGKLYVMKEVPTAENLAKHWFDRLAPKIDFRSSGNAILTRLRVYETPTCWAEYPAKKFKN